MIPQLVLVRIHVTLTSRIYKRGRDPLKTDHSTPEGIQTIIQDIGYYAPHGPNLSKVLCSLHFRVPDLGISSPKLTTLGIPLGGQPVKY
jgi:hypothetical protein